MRVLNPVRGAGGGFKRAVNCVTGEVFEYNHVDNKEGEGS